MEIEDLLDKKIEEWVNNESNKIASRINLYGSGLKAKLRQAEFALNTLKGLIDQDYSRTTSTQNNSFSHEDKIHFFVDTFFSFLYSSFDILAQIINQRYKLGQDERKVGFKSIIIILGGQNPRSPLHNLLEKVPNKYFFINLDKYRNCSLHRRQIYITTTTTSITETPGYSTPFSGIFIRRFLCDDPYFISPKLNQKRVLLDYCADVFNKVIIEIKNIANNI